MKTADKFRVIQWSTNCPYCEADIDYDGGAEDFPEEDTVFRCPSCKRLIKSAGWCI